MNLKAREIVGWGALIGCLVAGLLFDGRAGFSVFVTVCLIVAVLINFYDV